MKNSSKKFDLEKSVAFMRDSFVPFSDAHVSIASSPVLYGLAVYTVLSLNRSADGKKLFAFRLEDHFKRLQNSARIMDFHGFLETWTYERFEQMIENLVEKNGIKNQSGDFLVRVSIFIDAVVAGTKIHGLPNAVSAYIYPMGEILSRAGVNLCVSSYCRNPDNAIPARAKVNGGYVNSSLMKNEALMNGYDDAIALDRDGYVTEGTVANIFLIKNGVLITPSVDFDILEGITRNSLISLAADLQIPVQERAIQRSELYTAEEAFVCGTSARITPILSIDKRKIGEGKAGKLTASLTQKYEDLQRGMGKEGKEWRKEI